MISQSHWSLPLWVISPRNLTSFTRPFLTGSTHGPGTNSIYPQAGPRHVQFGQYILMVTLICVCIAARDEYTMLLSDSQEMYRLCQRNCPLCPYAMTKSLPLGTVNQCSVTRFSGLTVFSSVHSSCASRKKGQPQCYAFARNQKAQASLLKNEMTQMLSSWSGSWKPSGLLLELLTVLLLV